MASENQNANEDLQMMLGVSKHLQSLSDVKRHRTSSIYLVAQENFRARLLKMKEDRYTRSQNIGMAHQFIIEMVALYLNIPANEVFEFVLDEPRYITLFDEFLDADGRHVLVFYYQDGPIPPIESGRYSVAPPKNSPAIKRLFITDGYSIPLTGRMIVAYRINNTKCLDMKNINEELNMIQFDIDMTPNTVSIFYCLFEYFSKPNLDVTTEWGDLVKSSFGERIKQNFIGEFNSFMNYFRATKYDLEEAVVFNVDTEILNNLSSSSQIKEAALDVELVNKVNSIVRNWHKKIERVLTQFQQLRRENEFVGPLVEIEYWRHQLTKFTSIVEFMKSSECMAYINLLIQARSKLIKIWKKQDIAVTNARNECSDNVKYLYSLEKYCDPLYRCDPTEIPHHLPQLLYAIRMVFTTSRYYNNTANITAILVKISNQMINVCRKYLSCNGTKTVWKQFKDDVLAKIKVCLDLYLRYYQCFKELQRTMAEANEPAFDCSEMYVFGKFETFKLRLEKIVDVLETTRKYSILQSSNIEGIDYFATLFNKFYVTISSHTYDALNHRLDNFDKDYAIFRQSIVDAEWELEEFVGIMLEKMLNVDNVIRILKRFEKLNLDCLHIDERYLEAIEMFQGEIENIRDCYNEERQNPLLPRNMPPVSGRIYWIRHLYKMIEDPMNVFKQRYRVMRHRKAQKCIQMYNALASVFLHYEQIYYVAWYEHVAQVRYSLGTSLLIKHPQNKQYIINFDPYIIEMLRETEYISKLNLEVPDTAQIVHFCKDKILRAYERMVNLIKRNQEIRESIPLLFVPLMRPLFLKIEDAFHPGLSSITWTSLKIPEYCDEVESVLDWVEDFIKDVTDMKETRVERILDAIAQKLLVFLPDYPMSPEELLKENIKHREQIELEIEKQSRTAEICALELVNKFMNMIVHEDDKKDPSDWLDPSIALRPVGSGPRLNTDPKAAFREIDRSVPINMATIYDDCNELFAYFNMKLMDSLIKCTKLSLEEVKKRAMVHSTDAKNYPLIQTYLELHIPIISINPNLDLIQSYFKKILDNVLEASRQVILWGQRCEKKGKKTFGFKQEYQNCYKAISENKEIIRIYITLQGILYLLHPDVQKLQRDYSVYKYLWAEDRNDQLHSFCEQNPLVVEISEKFQSFEDKCKEIKNLPDIHNIGPIQILMERFKLALHVESEAWKHILGKSLSDIYREKLTNMVEFIKEHLKILLKTIKDLDDCRIAMACLERIRANFIEMDLDMELMEEAYATFNKFNVDVRKDDIERIDTLRYNFINMINQSKIVQEKLCLVQGPFQAELIAGVEKFKEDLVFFDEDFDINGPMVPGLSAKEASDRVLLYQAKFDELMNRFEIYSSGEKLFGMEVHDYPILLKRKREFNLLNKLYGLYLAVNQSIDGYFDILWSDIDTETITAELADFQLRCRKLPSAMKDWPAFIDLKQKVDDFNEICPLIEMMANKAMKERHWDRISKLISYEFDFASPTFTLKNVMEAPLLGFKEEVEDICIGAVKEKDIEIKLKQTIADWSIVNLAFSNFKSRGELLLKGTETGDIIVALEDSLMILNSLLSNRYNAPFKKEIQLWVSKLVNTSEILEKWMLVQNLWVYLEAVFVGGDIAKQLPAEAKRFANIDKSWVKIMYRARENPNAVECCTSDETMGQLLPHLLDQLESCQKSLTGYLETKRLCFPRFFFISDPVLLEILGQSSDPTSIQPHLLSLFDAVYRVEFDERRPDHIIAMMSDLGEYVPFEKSVQCIHGVEIWLNSLLFMVKETVRNVIAAQCMCLKDPEYDFITGFRTFCGQAGLLGIQILWTKEAEYAILRSRIDRTIMKNTNERFLALLNSLIELTAFDLTPMDRTRFETMITIHVHQKDIFDDMVRLRIKLITDFEWAKQSRFYFDEESEEVIVKITDTICLYQNEYLGITERLCITPLTDRCYITLAQALWMNMGGAPAGPAGTGKTETVKDMGRSLGKLVVVFNCSDQMDFRGLGRIFKGLAQSGSWGCFDEFNRIELPVLSVAAQQIYIVLQARKERRPSFIFSDGDTVTMNIEFGIFLTMNPGYAGRQELPENLKIQFRSVAMMVPDRQIIIRVKLASCGFKDNIILARKFFTLYQLCEEQLSNQVHYDFGLRNILSVLRTLGAQKRENPSDTEDTIVMRVLRDMNLSKLVDEDEPLFLSLIEDMFPGIKLSTHEWKALQRAITTQSASMGLINYPSWNLKIIQLYETSLVRHGLMVLGPTGAGKTKCMHCLMQSMTQNGLPHKELRMNPKAITAPQMFGRLDVATNDWTDGIFSTLWRRTHKFKKTDYCWLVLDGPVDAVWIENLNSVLDDNKTLTLANGDRIIMAPNSKIVFEPDNVDNASPATVSRMGMVFMSASVLPWKPILESWLITRPLREANILRTCFHKIYGDLHSFVQIRLKAKMFIREAIYIRQCYDVLQGVIDTGEEQRILPEKHLERLFLFATMWSLGAVLELDDRELLQQYALTHRVRMDWPPIKENETIFEYVVSGKKGLWKHWTERVEPFIYPPDRTLEFASILVPNVDNVRTAFLIHTIAKQHKSVILIGEQGTAKTVMIKGYLSTFDPEYKLSKSFNFSSETTPNMVQRIIESYVDKRVGTTYGPPAGKTLTIFIDDINMPVINDWGDQITNEIVRQLMENRGFYSLDKPGDFSTILDCTLMAAMIHPGGGRNDIPHRLKRQFSIFNCTLPSNNSMDRIFGQIGEGYFCPSRFKQVVVNLVPTLITLTRNIWQQTKTKMLPTPAKFHYVFNLRDLSRIWQGMTTVQGLECQTINSLLKLWQHECTRVIADRFITHKDRGWFIDNLRKQAKEELGNIFDEHFPQEETYWVDFLREPPEATGDEPDDFVFEAPKIYEEIPSWEFVLEKLQSFVEQYNENVRGGILDLVFFHDCLVHLLIISRIIRTPRGNALLVGVGGSGKQSLTRLASSIAGYQTFQLQLTRSYNMSNLMDDMKFLYKTAGFEGIGMTFIFTDNEIKEETFLESLNNVLSSGEIANLFAKDELDEIQTELIPIMKKEDPKRVPTNDNLYDFFISRARSNLHVVLCFSPVGEKFRSRALKFPGLISGCTIDWFQKWPKDALVAVATHFIAEFPIVCTPEVKIQLIDMMGDLHDSVSELCTSYFDRFRRQTFVTPKTYLSFLECYKTLYVDKKEAIDVLAIRMKTGLTKLVEAQVSVDILKQDLVKMDKDIAVATEAAEKVLISVVEATEVAEKIKEEALVVKERAENLVQLISVDQAEAESKLLAAKPALDAAEQALQTIKAADIATVRKLGKPPYLITLIMDAVLIYFGKRLETIKPDADKQFFNASWNESLKVMADTRFLMNLQNYPKDKINAEIVDLLVPYFNYHLYTFENAKTACGNVAGLISWTRAMAAFYEVNREVLPLKANLVKQQAKLAKAEGQLQAAMELLQTKEEEVRQCQIMYDAAMADKQAVLDEAMKIKTKMDAATALINGLSGERVRWTEQSAQFQAETERLVGDVLILIGFLSYAGPFNQEYRALMQKIWIKDLIKRRIPFSMNISIVDSLTDTATIGEWNLQGLPSDELSVQNGIIVTKGERFPLLIDPQSQGKAWINSKERQNGLVVTSLNHKYFRNHVEDTVSLGYPMIIEDINEELDPVLDDVLEKNFIKVGTQYKVKIGDKEVDVSDYRIYITTKLANPNYTPEIFARTSIIDFTVTMKGLEDQLLGRVILTEKKELEAERTNLITDVTINKRKMLELEQNLLYKLTTIQGSLLDDVTVIEVLNVTKTTAAEVSEKLAIAKETEIKINTAREEYRPVATRGSVLYFLITSMAMVNCMYQTSLVQFLEHFDISLFRSKKSPVTAIRINFIIDYLTYEIFNYKSRGLYEQHKYMFVLMMSLKIDLQRHHITHEEFQNFIKGGAALDLNACPSKPAAWITDMTWLNLVELSKLRHFQYILSQVESNDKTWKVWFDKDAPEEATIPDNYNSLDVFRKLLLIRAWSPDRTLVQSRKYIASSLGPKFAEAVVLNMTEMFEESRPLTPLICFLSTGADPTPYIEQQAKRVENSCKSISMGQGQEVHARKLLAQAMADGFWALLQNCHLGLDYMEEILVQFLELEKSNTYVHPDFRLWLTTEEHIKFPISLLQICIKFTNEPPSGIKAGLMRTYTTMNQDMLDYSDAPQYLPLIYAISFLHTVVQERRKFGPLGWNIPYEFNSADWLASCMFVQNHLDEVDVKKGISWSTVRYMLGEVQYGGRVTDDYDKRLLNTFSKVWFSEAMFSEEFNFYTGYKIYKFKNLNEYVQTFESMPNVDPPQAYGLHPNADITYLSSMTSEMLFTIVSIQPKESSGGGSGETREALVARLSSDMLQKLPPDYDFYEVKDRLRIMGHLNPLNIFLKQEIDRMQKVISMVRHTLTDLLLAIEGTIIMSEALRDALDNIYDARVPMVWRRDSWESSTIGFWFTDLLERNGQFRDWCFTGRPATFWMTGFFNPQGFLTATRQEVARAHKGWALDQVTMHNDVTKLTKEELKSSPPEGVYVHGLFLDGAGWDKRNVRLTESTNKVLYTLIPVVHIYAIYSTAPKDSSLYMCPVYKKPKRTDLNYITPLWLKSVKHPDHWILRGVALLCDIK